MKTRFWLSFAIAGKNLGIVLAEADSVEQAVKECSRRGCNPGGEALGHPIPPLQYITPKEVRRWFANTPSYTLIDVAELPDFLSPRKLSAKDANDLDRSGTTKFVCKDCNEVHQN